MHDKPVQAALHEKADAERSFLKVTNVFWRGLLPVR
jgi:hypothetical protein